MGPYQIVNGLQVTSAVRAGMVWALESPERDIVEADEMDIRRGLEFKSLYLGAVVGENTDWTPLKDRGGLFSDNPDLKDP